MLRQTTRRPGAWSQLIVPKTVDTGMQQSRGIKLLEIFSKEKRTERHKKIMDELNRGYFDDFKDFRERQGKVFFAPERLVPASHAPKFPAIEPLVQDGCRTAFPPTSGAAAPASLVCVAFRAGAQEMLEAWAAPFSRRFQAHPGARLYELALIESPIMALWPFRGMLLKSGTRSQARYAMPATFLFHFGDTQALRAALAMSNRLTGYAYLVDGSGRVRWRGSGTPEEKELQLLLKCADSLLHQAPEPEDPGELEAAGSL